MKKTSLLSRLWSCLKTGFVKGIRSSAWLLAIMVPVSLGMTVLKWAGVVQIIAGWMSPAFRLFGLPGETAIAFLTGALPNIYSCIAVLGNILLTDRQITILAVMSLISHNFPVEAAVQHKAGSTGWKMVVLRLLSSIAAGVVLNLILPDDPNPARARGLSQLAEETFWPMMGAWFVGMSKLVGKVIAIIAGLMILQRILDEFGIVRVLSKLLAPLLWLIGLPESTAFLWVVGNTLGLAYGGAVIVEEMKIGALDKRDMGPLNVSLAVCHSLLEDTLLFTAIGAWALWITVPRVALAAILTWGFLSWRRIRIKQPPV